MNLGNQIQSVTLQQSGGVPTNRITSVTAGSTVNYTYDAAGNVTSDGLHSYVYDAENRLVSMDSGAAQYKYDHQNRRVCKVVGSAWTHYIWEGGQVISEHDATTAYTTNPTYQVNSARVDYVYSGSRMIYNRQRASSGGAWTSRYYLSDRLSERLVTDTSGNVVGRQGHLPFGEDFASSGSQEKHHFTNYERDSESGTDYALNRQYNQSAGRFMRVDPEFGSIGNPQSLNRYAYAWNDAVNLIDPLGLEPWILPPDENVPEGTCYYYGSYEICHLTTGNKGNPGAIAVGKGKTGSPGSSEAPPKSPGDPRVLVKDFFDKNEHCREVFSAIKFASGVKLLDQVLLNNESVPYIDLQDKGNAGLLTQTFYQAGLVAQGDIDANLVMGTTGLGPNGKYTAYTDALNYKIYLGQAWGHNQWNAGAVGVHELLHTVYNLMGGALAFGPHAFIAKELNIRVDPGVDPADAIDKWLKKGCKDPPLPKK